MKNFLVGKLMRIFAAVVFGLSTQWSIGDVPDKSSDSIQGMYKVVSSNDPIFPIRSSQEWFLDFGKGLSGGKMSGDVAVSLRQNPNVKVRIMAWQYFPNQDSLVIGNPFAEGSNKAVAKGSWQLSSIANGLLLRRGNHQMVFHRADPVDY